MAIRYVTAHIAKPPSQPRHHCVSASPPGPASGGPSSPTSPSATTARPPTSAASFPGGTALPCAGSASTWGFAIYHASHDDYQDSTLSSDYPADAPQEAHDCASGPYLGDHTAWLNPPPAN